MHELRSSFTYWGDKVIICVNNQIKNPTNAKHYFKLMIN